MEYLENPTIVIDNGSCHLKIGFENEKLPIAHIPNMTGCVTYTLCSNAEHFHAPCECVRGISLVGYEVINQEANFLTYNVRNGHVSHWGSLEFMYDHIIRKTFAMDPTKNSFMIIDSPFNGCKYRYKMAEFLFEKFNIPGMSIVDKAAMSLNFADRHTGVVVDCGASGTDIIPVYKGRPIARAAQRIKVGGDAVSRVLMKYMIHRDYKFQTLKDVANVNDLKAKFCYVADNFWKYLARDITHGSVGCGLHYHDQSYIQLGEERYVCAEALFNPSWAGERCPGIPTAIIKTLDACHKRLRPTLRNNIVLCGGSSLLRGFPERVAKELSILPRADVIALPHREAAAWIGGSKTAAGMKQSPSFITREMYQENGANIIRKICI